MIVLLSLGALLVLYVAAAIVATVKIASPVASVIAVTPDSLGLKYEDVTFQSRVDNLKLRGWYIPGGEEGAVIMAHGGKGNRGDKAVLALAADLAKRGFNVLAFDRRDCGESERSRPKDRPHLERDFAGAFDFVKARSGPDGDIFLWGTSMGALAAIIFASEGPDVKGVVLDSCFSNTPRTLKRLLAARASFFSFVLPGVLLAGRMLYGVRNSGAIDYVGSVSSPILFVQGNRDDAVPVGDAYELLGASKNPASQVWVVECGNHSNGYDADPSLYLDKIISFFDATVRQGT